MIDAQRLEVFLHAMEGPDRKEDYFSSLRKRSQEDAVPIIRRETEHLLHVLLSLKKPAKILEVGCAVGYSALRMASFTPDETTVTTIEKDPERSAQARENFAAHPFGKRITLIEGDAQDVLAALGSGEYGFIFMDAAKGQYLSFLPDVLRVLETGGVLVSDNVLQEGMVLAPESAVEHRDRTIHKRMRDYLLALRTTDGLITTIIPSGDGAAVTIKEQDTVRICTDRENCRSF